MADSDDFQALENISTEVDNSQVKILISSHCIKAQAFLLDKLRKQTERQKDICKFVGTSNLKLEAEIKLAEQEVKSFNVAIDTIKLGNIELNKEYLLCKERKAEILERIKIGKKKYENLWLASKKRYETIPIVKKLNEFKNKNQTAQANINTFINESSNLVNKIILKKKNLLATDKARVIELAEFLVHERPKLFIKINEYNVKTNEMTCEVEMLKKEGKNNRSPDLLPAEHKQVANAGSTIQNSSFEEDNWPNLSKNTEKDTLLLPKLHLQNNDLDILSVKLEQIKKNDLQNASSINTLVSTISSSIQNNSNKSHKTEEKDNENNISSYFDVSLATGAGNNDKKNAYKNYSEKKLIHILEDIKLDNTDTHKIINKLVPAEFHETMYITPNNIHQYEKISNSPDKNTKSLVIKEIDDTEVHNKRKEDFVDPPSQFLDVSQGTQDKKSVAFNVPNKKDIPNSLDDLPEEVGITKSQEKMLNNSTLSEESYTTIKNKTLKKRKLDLSPQFIYSKTVVMHKEQENKITSKFFESEDLVSCPNDMNTDDCNEIIKQKQILKCDEDILDTHQNETCSMDNNVVVSSPKSNIKELEIPVAGLLFNHGPQGIPDSLNLSISTTGFEDTEDFPHCIDSSILLSPKADISGPVECSNNHEVLPHSVPNFLAGFRKTGLSFFGSTSSSNAMSDTDAQPQSGGFNFAFSKDEKKGRGGFFSMFQ